LEIIRESGVDVMDGDKYDLTFIKHVADKAMWAKWNRNNSR
jgi:hypothetical protein